MWSKLMTLLLPPAHPAPRQAPPHRRLALRHPPPRQRRLHLEPLEDRCVPSTFTVTNLADAGPGSLREAILAANASPGADVITFGPAVRGTLTLTSGELVVSDALTISGPGAGRLTVSGNQASRIFDVSGAQVSISGLTVADGLATGKQALGGGLLNSGGQVNLTEVIFTNNLARGDTGPNPIAGGGAVANVSGGALTIVASTFTGNQSFGPNRGAGGAILNDTASALSVADTYFTDNRATCRSDPTGLLGGFGGAIANLGDSSAAIFDGTFTGNQARGVDGAPGQDGGFATGGAIESSGVSLLGNKVGRPVLTIAKSLFSGNQAVGGAGGSADGSISGGKGGGGFNGAIGAEYGSTVRIADTVFRGNRALGGAGGNSSSAAAGGDGGEATGGALGNENSFLTVERSTFTENQAVGGVGGNSQAAGGTGGLSKGGAVHQVDLGYYPGVHSITTLTDSLLTGNQAIGGAGGDGGTGQGGNTRPARGGALSLNQGTMNVIHCTLDGNQALGGAGGPGATPGHGGEARGGGLIVDTGETQGVLTVSDHCLLRNNQAIGGGGGVAGSGLGGGLFVGVVSRNSTATATVTDTTIENNQAIGGAGTIQGGDGLGGGAYVSGGHATLTLLSTTVTENQAQGGAGATPGAGVGGGVYNLGAFAFDVFTVIRKNHASTSDPDIAGPYTTL